MLAWDDVLNEGPVPAVPRRELLRLRARFLADAGWGTATTIRAELERRDEILATGLAEGRSSCGSSTTSTTSCSSSTCSRSPATRGRS